LRRHAGSGNSFPNNACDVVVRERPAEFALQQVDAGNLIAFRAVTINAVVGVLPSAVFDIGGGVFMLRQQRAARQKENTS
jgi:hypothetical protein